MQLTDASQVATSCAIRGYKVTRAPMVIHMLAFWGLSLPLGCVLGLAPGWLPFGPAEPMGAHGFWIALVVALTVVGAPASRPSKGVISQVTAVDGGRAETSSVGPTPVTAPSTSQRTAL